MRARSRVGVNNRPVCGRVSSSAAWVQPADDLGWLADESVVGARGQRCTRNDARCSGEEREKLSQIGAAAVVTRVTITPAQECCVDVTRLRRRAN